MTERHLSGRHARAHTARSGEAASHRFREERFSAVAVVAFVAAAALVLYLARTVLLPFVVGGALAYVCAPVVDWLVRRTRRPRWLFAAALLLVLTGLLAMAGFFGTLHFARELDSFVQDLPDTLSRAAHDLMGNRRIAFFGTPLDASGLANGAMDALHKWIEGGGTLHTLAAVGLGGLFGLLFAWILLCYFLLDTPRIASGLMWLVPPRHRPFALRVWQDLNPVLRRYLVGLALVVLYASVAAYIGLGVILKLHHAVMLALMTALLEMIPVIGPVASGVLAGLIAVQQAKSAWDIGAYAVYAVALRVSIDQLLAPLVLGRSAQLRPVVIIFSFALGAALLGVLGALISVPVALAVRTVLTVLYEPAERQSP